MSSSIIEEHQYLNWDEFRHEVLNCIENCSNPDNKFVFRGHSSIAYGLEAGFDRTERGKSKNSRTASYKIYIDNISAAIHRAGFMENLPYIKSNDANFALWETVIQHHGGQTRLLDWSWSPYVAAFFAAHTNKNLSSDMVIWMLDVELLKDFISTESCEICENSVVGLSRLDVQQGCFTRNKSIYRDLLDLFIAAEQCGEISTSAPIIRKFIVRSNQRANMIRELSLMGINEARLFPGIDGICRFFNSTAK